MINVTVCHPPFSDNITTVRVEEDFTPDDVQDAVREAFTDIGVTLPEGNIVCLEEIETGDMIPLKVPALQDTERDTIHALVISRREVTHKKAGRVPKNVKAPVKGAARTNVQKPNQYIGVQEEKLIVNSAYTQDVIHAEEDWARQRTSAPSAAEHVAITSLVRKYATSKKKIRNRARYSDQGLNSSASTDFNSTAGSADLNTSTASTGSAAGGRPRLIRPRTAPRQRTPQSSQTPGPASPGLNESGQSMNDSAHSGGSPRSDKSPTIEGQPWKPIWERDSNWQREQVERKLGLSVTDRTAKRLEKEYRDTFKPSFCKNSRRMMSAQRNRRPLYERVLDDQERQKKKREHEQSMADEDAKKGREVVLNTRSSKLMSDLANRPKFYERDFGAEALQKEAERERQQAYIGDGDFTRKPKLNNRSRKIAEGMDRVRLDAKDDEMSDNLTRLVSRISQKKDDLRQQKFNEVFTGKPETTASPKQKEKIREERARDKQKKNNEKKFMNESIKRNISIVSRQGDDDPDDNIDVLMMTAPPANRGGLNQKISFASGTVRRKSTAPSKGEKAPDPKFKRRGTIAG